MSFWVCAGGGATFWASCAGRGAGARAGHSGPERKFVSARRDILLNKLRGVAGKVARRSRNQRVRSGAWAQAGGDLDADKGTIRAYLRYE